jgi:hypothetical protein
MPNKRSEDFLIEILSEKTHYLLERGFSAEAKYPLEDSMIYLGHFSFVSNVAPTNEVPELSHGYLTCVAEADSTELALRTFEVVLRRLKRSDELFSGVDNVHLDSCIEIRSIPKRGLLIYFNEERGESQPAVSTSLFRSSTKYAVAYEWMWSDPSQNDCRREPFLVFEAN